MEDSPAVGRASAGLAALTLVALAPLGAVAPARADTTGVSVRDGSAEFAPDKTRIRVGDTVRWTNNSIINEHNVSASGGGWSFARDLAPLISSDPSSASFTFSSPGRYSYVCRLHQGMGGTVIVTGGGTPPPRPTARPTSRPPAPSRSASPATPPPTGATPTPISSATPRRTASQTAPSAGGSPRPPDGAAARPSPPQQGLTSGDPTGRERGLPALVALTMVVGIGTAHIRVRRLLPVPNGRHRLSPDRPRGRRSVGRDT